MEVKDFCCPHSLDKMLNLGMKNGMEPLYCNQVVIFFCRETTLNPKFVYKVFSFTKPPHGIPTTHQLSRVLP